MDILTLSGFVLALVALVGGSILKGAGVKGLLGAAALVLWRAHRRNVVRVGAPGAAVPAEPAPAQQIPQEAAVTPPPWRQDDGNQTR